MNIADLLRRMRVGYVPNSADLKAPGDRRRFSFYAQQRAIPFEIALPHRVYDLVVLSTVADIGFWSRFPRGTTTIVYDLIDSYFALPWYQPKAVMRGLAKYISGQQSTLQLSYRSALKRMCMRADAVICSTEEQRSEIQRFCNNVHIILDSHSHVISSVKTSYGRGEVVNIAWEGLPVNCSTLLEVNDVLAEMSKRFKIRLHIATDLTYKKYMGKYVSRSTQTIINRLSVPATLYEWNERTLSTVLSACDLGIIPIPLTNPFLRGKPENKLALMWRVGLPVIVSSTPAYSRAMLRAGLKMACANKREWYETLRHHIEDEPDRAKAGMLGRAFVETNLNDQVLLSRWDELFSSIKDLGG
jgi:hypothetical protein